MDLQKIIVRLMADATQYNRVMDSALARMGNIGLRFISIGRMISTGAMSPIAGGAAAVAVGLQGMAAGAFVAVETLAKIGEISVAVGGYVLGMAADFESAKVQMEVMAGSARVGAKLLTDIQALAIRSPFKSSDLIKTGQMLLGMGVSTDMIMPALARLGEVAAGDALRLQRLAYAAGQVSAASRFMGTEMRQFTEAGVGVADFAKAANMSTFQFQAAMRQGRIGADVMWEGINRLTDAGGRFAGMNDKVFKTVKGQYNALMETVEVLAAKIGIRLFSAFDVAGFLAKTTQVLTGLQQYTEPFVDFLKKVGEVAMAAWQPMEAFFSVLFETVQKNRDGLQGLLPTMEELKTGIAGFVKEGLSYLLKMVEWLAPTTEFILKNLRRLTQFALGVVQVITLALGAIGVVASTVMNLTGYGENSMVGPLNAAMETMKHMQTIMAGVGDGLEKGTLAAGGFAAALRKGLDEREWKGNLFGNTPGAPGDPGKPSRITPKPEVPPDLRKWVEDMNNAVNKKDAAKTYVEDMKRLQEASQRWGLIQGEAVTGVMKKIYGDFANNSVKALATPHAQYQATARLMTEGMRRGLVTADQASEKIRDAFDKYAQDAKKRMEGMGVYDRFRGELSLQNERLMAGLMNPRQAKTGLFDMYQDLAKNISERQKISMPSSARFGSSEAQDIFNRSNYQGSQKPESQQAQIIRVLQETKRIQEERAKREDEFYRAWLAANGNQPQIVVRGQ